MFAQASEEWARDSETFRISSSGRQRKTMAAAFAARMLSVKACPCPTIRRLSSAEGSVRQERALIMYPFLERA